MSKIVWDNIGEHFYETGVKNGVLYMFNGTASGEATGTNWTGVAWNGLTAVTESPSGAEATALYADDFKYLNLYSAEEFGATVEAYTYPDEFAECDGSRDMGSKTGVSFGQQERKSFALCYKTTVGNDTKGNDLGYKIHIIYGCKASPSERSYSTINDSPEAITFSWELTTTPISIANPTDIGLTAGTNVKPIASIIIDSTKFGTGDGQYPVAKLTSIENALYGTDGTPGSDPHLLFPDEIYDILSAT